MRKGGSKAQQKEQRSYPTPNPTRLATPAAPATTTTPAATVATAAAASSIEWPEALENSRVRRSTTCGCCGLDREGSGDDGEEP